MRRLLLALLCVALLGLGCSNPAPVPPEPPQPGPGPGPDPQPGPTPVVDPVPYAKVEQIKAGMDRAALVALMGGAPMLDVRQDDGTWLLRWPCLNKDGATRKCDVQIDAAGIVLGYGLWR